MSPAPRVGWEEVRRRRSRLEQALTRAKACTDLETQSDLAKLLVVQISGYVEKSLRELLLNLCRRHVSGPVLNYAAAQLDWTRNPSDEAIEALLRQFSVEWADRWTARLRPEEKAALNSVVGLRNSIAHGDDPSVSLGRVIGYLLLIDDVMEWLISTIDPIPA